MLLVGIDERSTIADGARADSIILLHIPATHDRAYLMSIPRDSRVPVPAFAATNYPGGWEKITDAFDYGFGADGSRARGMQLLSQTVTNLTGLRFDGAALVNFAGFQQVVDAVGGIDMCVDEEVVSVHIGWNIKTGKEGIPYRLTAPAYNDPHLIPGMRAQVYEPGCRHFVGWEALDYVRQRELLSDGDYGRQRHQQQFIKALTAKVAGAGFADPLKLDGIIRAAGKTVTFDGGGVSLVDWVFTLKGITSSNVVMLKANGGHFNPEVIDGRDFEILDESTKQGFQAMITDHVDAFAQAHPDLVTAG
jgi:LCP family protein required for cell wall assembly